MSAMPSKTQGLNWINSPDIMMTIEENITEIKKSIAVLEQKYGRENGSVRLLPASKSQSLEKMAEAIRAGLRCFGENYLQEALVKMNAFGAADELEWHFIGPIQRNKTRKIAENFVWVHSVADMTIATRLNDQRPSHLPPLNICIEVNVSDEESKSGMTIDAVKPLASHCLTLPHLRLRGLMTIPAPKKNLDEQRKEFHKLLIVFQQLLKQGFKLDTLSMGMSDDFEAAIAEGSTLIRIGTAIFGQR
jgi:PLP dependent protein